MNKIFEHDILPKVQLEQINDPAGRYYLHENEKYVSCTTLIGKMLDYKFGTKSIDSWKKRVGEKEANEIRDRAAAKGTALHTICENYILNDPDYRKGVMPPTFSSFKSIKPFLDNHVTKIYGVEHRAYSKHFKVAGTVDLICECNGQRTIIDFKTSKREKKKSHILKYFLQATMYAQMVKETYGILIPQLVILIAVENEIVPQIFAFRHDKYLSELENLYESYHENQNNG